MNENERKRTLFKMLPGTDKILELSKDDYSFENIPKTIIVNSIRYVVQNLRDTIQKDTQSIGEDDLSDSLVIKKVRDEVKSAMATNLTRLINATGVVVHTNLGRSLLSPDAIEQLSRGERGRQDKSGSHHILA